HLRSISVHLRPLILFTLLTSCTSATPTPIYVTATPAPVGVSVGSVTSNAPLAPFVTETPPILPFSGTIAAPVVTPTIKPTKTLDVCLPTEPQSLYEYSGGEREAIWARKVVLEGLRDGPIDHRNFEYQPVILDKLPSLKDGDAVILSAQVREGEIIVDASGNLTTLGKDVHYFDATGSEQVHTRGAATVMQMSVQFRLRDGLKWEDGAPLTADDLLFGWQIAKDPANTVSDHYLANRALDPAAIDSRTLQLTFLPGFKDPLYYTRLPLPFPRHLYGQLAPAQLAADVNVTRRPLSYGPFVMQEWAAGSHITLAKNPNYFRAAEGLPHLDQISFRFTPDTAQMIEWVRNGVCDVGLSSQDTFFSAQLELLGQASTQGVFTVQHVSSTTYEHLDFNISPVDGYGGLANSRMFEDVRVRQAFAYCLNRKELIDVLLRGRGDVPSAYVPAAHPYFDPIGLDRYPFDAAKGKALLQEAGWIDSNGDGVLDRRGRKLSLDYAFGPTGNTLRETIAALASAQFKENCGIEAKPRAQSRADFFGDFPDGVLFGRQYDLAQFSWVGGETEPSCGLYTRGEWTGLGDGQPDKYGLAGYPGGGNNVGYINPTFDELCRRALDALDPVEKRSFHQQAMKLFAQETPSVILFFRPRLALVRPNVLGFLLDSTQDSGLWNVEMIDVIP
ncbi:MAG TPA: peptide ABC transporter substrate-binding protein, partial [Anaerolineales bacterium]|nr:peptide ABC transporter substrate-binding protein [Anaerolineales bacterium]